jgi:hypothetical protein
VVAGLCEGVALRGEQLQELRLAGCGLTDEAACRLARLFESAGATLRCVRVCNGLAHTACGNGT